MSPGRHKKQLTLPPSPAHTSPPRILEHKAPRTQVCRQVTAQMIPSHKYFPTETRSLSPRLSQPQGCKKAESGHTHFLT